MCHEASRCLFISISNQNYYKKSPAILSGFSIGAGRRLDRDRYSRLDNNDVANRNVIDLGED
jgi:hypothetical protein